MGSVATCGQPEAVEARGRETDRVGRNVSGSLIMIALNWFRSDPEVPFFVVVDR